MERIYTVKEAAQALHVDVHFVYKAVNDGKLTAMRMGGIKIREGRLQKFVIDWEKENPAKEC